MLMRGVFFCIVWYFLVGFMFCLAFTILVGTAGGQKTVVVVVVVVVVLTYFILFSRQMPEPSFFILLTHEGTHRVGRSLGNSITVMTLSSGGVKGCSDHRFHATPPYTISTQSQQLV